MRIVLWCALVCSRLWEAERPERAEHANEDTKMAKTNMSDKMTNLVKALRAKNGATGPELRVILDRVWAPTVYQLRPIADKFGFELRCTDGKDHDDGLMHYYFWPKAEKTAKASKTVAATKKAKHAGPATIRRNEFALAAADTIAAAMTSGAAKNAPANDTAPVAKKRGRKTSI